MMTEYALRLQFFFGSPHPTSSKRNTVIHLKVRNWAHLLKNFNSVFPLYGVTIKYSIKLLKPYTIRSVLSPALIIV